jgi:chitin disaccharide deacetylase
MTKAMSRAAIVNADDFGQSAGINRGIVEAHERGIVTSASLMVRWHTAPAAAAYARAHPRLSVGLHVDLGESIYRGGEWISLYERVNRRDARAVEAEIRGQLSLCRELLRRDPTHLDSHQHVHTEEPARSILDGIARELGVPLRHRSSRLRHDGRFYGQTSTGEPLTAGITPTHLVEMLRSLPEGVTEVACHPGFADDLLTMYRAERQVELAALCDPGVRRAMGDEGIALIGFADLQP